jgi:deazaflavin-dependent oxidoreductase (nitroreductase family)
MQSGNMPFQPLLHSYPAPRLDRKPRKPPKAAQFAPECFFMDDSRSHFIQPSITARWINWLFGVLVGWGIGFSHNYLLEVQGRKSGRIYSTPVNVLDRNGKRFLVGTRGETQWARNARASGRIWLKKGRRREAFRLRPLDDHEKPEILREYLNRHRTTVQRFFPIPAGSPLESFSAVASNYPVFELLAANN